MYNSLDFKEELQAYSALYLKEEIQHETLARNIQAFSEFLSLIALSNGQEINCTSLAKDFQSSPETLKNYLKVLSDTLLGFQLPGFTKTQKRKAISRFKHCFFDIGVVNTLCRRGEIQEKVEGFLGRALAGQNPLN